MHLLRAGTVSVRDLGTSLRAYQEWLDYEILEQGSLASELALSWGTPRMQGASYAVLGPASGAQIFVRLIEAPPVDDFVPLTTYGWAALEFCVTDVLATHERMHKSASMERSATSRRSIAISPNSSCPGRVARSIICSSTCWLRATCKQLRLGW